MSCDHQLIQQQHHLKKLLIDQSLIIEAKADFHQKDEPDVIAVCERGGVANGQLDISSDKAPHLVLRRPARSTAASQLGKDAAGSTSRARCAR